MMKSIVTATALGVSAMTAAAEVPPAPPTEAYTAPDTQVCEPMTISIYFQNGEAVLSSYAQSVLEDVRARLADCLISDVEMVAQVGDARSAEEEHRRPAAGERQRARVRQWPGARMVARRRGRAAPRAACPPPCPRRARRGARRGGRVRAPRPRRHLRAPHRWAPAPRSRADSAGNARRRGHAARSAHGAGGVDGVHHLVGHRAEARSI